jgi:hypothetical protein
MLLAQHSNNSCTNFYHSNSCKNSVGLALLPRVSKLALDPTFLSPLVVPVAPTPGPGHVAPPAVLLLGVLGTMTATTKADPPPDLPPAPQADLRPGLGTVVTAATAIGIVVIAAPMAVMAARATISRPRPHTALLQPRVPLPGTNRRALQLGMVDTQATAATGLLVRPREWAVLLLACLPRLLRAARRLAYLVDSMPSSASTPMLSRLRPHRRREMLRRLLRPWTCRLLLRVLRVDA